MVQDLATQWIQSYPCKTKSSQETEKSTRKFLSRGKSRKSFILTIHWNLAKLVKNYLGIIAHLRLTAPRSETNGIAGRAARRIKEGTSTVLLHSSLDEKWWVDSMECYCHLRNVQDLRTSPRTCNSFWFDDRTSSCFCQRSDKTPPIRSESFTWNIPGTCICMRRRVGKEIFW